MNNPWEVFPKAFLDQIALFPSDRASRILQGLSADKPTTFRVNTLVATDEEVLKELSDDGWVVEQIVWLPHAYIVRKSGNTRIASLPIFTQGKIYIQGLSSMIPAVVLSPQPDEKILDMTAAPGSKTTQMAAIMKNTGQIIANDISTVRLYKLKANLTTQHVTNVAVTQKPAESLWQTYPEYFDRVLVDVPCSMEGRFDATDPKSYEDWTSKKVSELSHRQQWIVRSAISSTKVGGTIVYSTCTLAPEENEAIVNWIVEKEKGAVVVEPCEINNFSFDTPIMEWKNKTFHPEVAKCGRVDPTPDMEGFFVAKLKKVRSTIPSALRNLQ